MIAEVRANQSQCLAEVEETVIDLRTTIAAKDMKISQLEKDNGRLEKKALVDEVRANKERLEAAEEAKVCAAKVILQAKIRMAQEALDSTFDRADWDVAGWKQRLRDLGEDVEEELEV